MNSHAQSSLTGRVLMTVATLLYGVLPPLVDLTETHVFHPGWTPHARMHMVWLLGTNSAIAVLALAVHAGLATAQEAVWPGKS